MRPPDSLAPVGLASADEPRRSEVSAVAGRVQTLADILVQAQVDGAEHLVELRGGTGELLGCTWAASHFMTAALKAEPWATRWCGMA